MLKPLRANSPATRASTPGLFSTVVTMVWNRGVGVIVHGGGHRWDGSTTISELVHPAGTIGNTFSPDEVRNSSTTGRSSISLALAMAGATSSGSSTRRAAQPMASAHFT